MKKKFKYILLGSLPLFGLLVSGCSLLPKRKTTTTTPTEPYNPPSGEPDDPGTADNYITAIHMVRTKDFFMSREEVLDFNVTFDGGGDDSQKEIAWQTSNPNVIKIGKHSNHPDLTRYCSLTALREGTATIVARSLFNTSLTASVTITVLDNSYYTYIWQVTPKGNEKASFVDADGYPAKTGTVNFGEMTWSYEFEKAPIAVTGGQSLKFGSKNDPFGALHFETENEKPIRKISVLCSSSAEHIDDGSAHGTSGPVGTSNITIKVGDTTYVDNVSTPKNSNDSTIELDTITGGIRDTNPMNGKISIDFSPTYYDGATKENSGAIYLKAIIIEYYRGELDRIEVSEVNEYNNQFYVGTKFDPRGVEVNAYFSASPTTKVNVNHLADYSMNNIDGNGNFINPDESQTITASYTYINSDQIAKTVTSDFQVKVANRIKEFKVSGSLTNTEYLVKDTLDYSGLNLQIISEGDVVVQDFNLNECFDDKFLAVFDVRNVQKYANKSLENEFAISFYHYLSSNTASYTFAAGSFVVKAVDSIEVIYDSTSPLSLIEGTKIDYADFKVKIVYDNEDEDEFKFSELKNQTYFDEESGKDLERYNYINSSPLVADKAFATTGFTVTVKSTLNNKSGSLELKPTENFSIKYISGVTLSLTTLSKTSYEECDQMDYTGVNVAISYSDETSETFSLIEAKALTYVKEKTTSTGNKTTENVPLFSINAPDSADKSMEAGFDISITSFIDSSITSTLHIDSGVISVTEIQAKNYTKIKSVDSLANVTGRNFVFVSYDGAYSMRVWNANLNESAVRASGNYFMINSETALGDNLSIKSGPLSRATFTLVSLGDGKFAIKHVNSNKYFGGDSAMYGTTSSAKTQFVVTFDGDGNALFKATYTTSGATEIRYIKFNTAGGSNKFGGYKVTNTNNKEIQLYELVG